MTRRIIYINCCLALALLIPAVYHIRYSAESDIARIQELKRDIRLEHDMQQTLRAEWSSLNDPRRLQVLARKYLSLGEVEVSQILSLLPSEILSMPASLTDEERINGTH